jgi:hypothetical protein
MRNEKGEGKLGCIVSMVVLAVLGAAAYKAVPVYYGDSELVDACDFIASAAARKPIEAIEREVKEKARELGVTELLADKKALRVSKTSSGDAGTCTIQLRYTRTIDFYGAYTWRRKIEKQITKPIYENI